MYDFTILVLENAYSSSVAVTSDMLTAAQALASRAQVASPRWRLCSVNGGIVSLQGGMSIKTTRLPENPRQDRSIWVIPGLGLNTATAVAQRFELPDAQKAITALTHHVNEGGEVAASCSAVFLLNAAGLLRGRSVTTTWWLAPLLQGISPDCTVNADRMISADGPIITAGAAFAQTDLMLHLLRERFGGELADTVSRMMLVKKRQAQAPFIIPEAMASGNDLVAKIAAKIESALPHPPTVSDLSKAFCMSERTLSRHIRKATGKSTLALVQSIKLRRARTLLETSRMSVEQIAAAVGYRDATALRRLMRKISGATPSHFRTDAITP